MRKEAMVGDMEAHITEGVKLLSHLEIVGKSFKVDLKAVFSGRLGVALWTEAIASAADEEEGGVPDEIHHLHEKIQGLWFRPREFEDMPIPVMIRGCEGFTTDGRNAILEAIFARTEDPFHFGRSRFLVHLRQGNDANDPATKLSLPSGFEGCLHDPKVRVADPPLLLAYLAHKLCEQHEAIRKKYKRKQREQISPAQRNTDDGVQRAETIRSALDHELHESTNFEALSVLYHLYKLMRPHLREHKAASWTQGPFGFNQSKSEINKALDDNVRIDIHEWLVQVKDELSRILGSAWGIEGDQRSYELAYEENLEVVRYFTSFFTREDGLGERKPYSRSNKVHYPSYPRNPHKVTSRDDSLSEHDASSLLY